MTRVVEEWIDPTATNSGIGKHPQAACCPKPLEIICCHRRQSAWKNIKARILFCGAGRGVTKRHDLSFLLDRIKNRVRVDGKFYNHADTLTEYGVVVRSPEELCPEERHAKKCHPICRRKPATGAVYHCP